MADITQEQIDQAKALGYTDAQIEEYLNPKAQETNLPAPGTQVPGQAMLRTPVVNGVAVNPANQPWVDRSQEQNGLVQGAALAAAGAGAATAGKLGLEYLAAKKALEAGGQAFRGTPAPAAPAPGPQIQVPTNAGGVPRPQPNIGTPQQVMDTLRQPAPGPQAGPATAEMGAGAQPRPIAGGAPAAEATTFLDRIAAMASKYAPAARVATGAGLMAYSPSLNTGEDEQLRQMRALQDQQRAQGLIR